MMSMGETQAPPILRIIAETGDVAPAQNSMKKRGVSRGCKDLAKGKTCTEGVLHAIGVQR